MAYVEADPATNHRGEVNIMTIRNARTHTITAEVETVRGSSIIMRSYAPESCAECGRSIEWPIGYKPHQLGAFCSHRCLANHLKRL